ncbi:MAG: hypothetical protein ACOX85_06540 [Candidatus Pararuminococcus gallinarum]|jgi:hypothetical protein
MAKKNSGFRRYFIASQYPFSMALALGLLGLALDGQKNSGFRRYLIASQYPFSMALALGLPGHALDGQKIAASAAILLLRNIFSPWP